MLSLTWALYDEFFGLRPWRSYQLRFADAYSSYLKRGIPKKETYDVELHTRDGKTEKKKLDFDALNELFTSLKDQKANLTLDRVAATKSESDFQAQMDEYKKEQLTGLTDEQLGSLLSAVQHLSIDIHQVNVNPSNVGLNNIGSGGLVDRCQSCHLGMDTKLVPPTMTLTKADLGLARSHDAPFTSHPELELLKIHDTDRFGCSPCHGGERRAVSRGEEAHGRD